MSEVSRRRLFGLLGGVAVAPLLPGPTRDLRSYFWGKSPIQSVTELYYSAEATAIRFSGFETVFPAGADKVVGGIFELLGKAP